MDMGKLSFMHLIFIFTAMFAIYFTSEVFRLGMGCRYYTSKLKFPSALNTEATYFELAIQQMRTKNMTFIFGPQPHEKKSAFKVVNHTHHQNIKWLNTHLLVSHVILLTHIHINLLSSSQTLSRALAFVYLEIYS